MDRSSYKVDSPPRSYLEPLRVHKTAASSLFPELKGCLTEARSFSTADAMFTGYFLEHLPGPVTVVEAGAGTGDSTLCLAEHAKVTRVVSFNTNSPVAGETGTLDVARGTVEENNEARAKVIFVEGPLEDPAALEGPAEGEKSLVLISSLYERESVGECLKAVFEWDPRTIVLVNGGADEQGLPVQAGVADFLEGARNEYSYRRVSGLGPALAGSGLGILYPGSISPETEETLQRVGREFSRKLDPLRLLGREEELMNVVSKVTRQFTQASDRMDRLQKQVSRLKKKGPGSGLEAELERQISHNEALRAHYSSRRYKLVDTLAGSLKRLPVVGKVLGRGRSGTGGD